MQPCFSTGEQTADGGVWVDRGREIYFSFKKKKFFFVLQLV